MPRAVSLRKSTKGKGCDQEDRYQYEKETQKIFGILKLYAVLKIDVAGVTTH